MNSGLTADDAWTANGRTTAPPSVLITAVVAILIIWLARFACSPTVLMLSLAGVLALALAALRQSIGASPLADWRHHAGSLVMALVAGLSLHHVVTAPRVPQASHARTVTADRADSRDVPEGRVELAGVSVDWYGAMSPVWWHTDGTVLRVRDWAMDPRYVPTVVNDRQQRMFAIKAIGTAHRPTILSVLIEGSPEFYRGFEIESPDRERSEWRGLARIFPRDQTETTVRVRVATGEFQPLPTDWDQAAQTLHAASDSITFAAALHMSDTGIEIRCPDDAEAVKLPGEFRIRARTSAGEWKVAMPRPITPNTAGAAPVWQLPAGELAAFQVEFRPAWWVEFPDVALSTIPTSRAHRLRR